MIQSSHIPGQSSNPSVNQSISQTTNQSSNLLVKQPISQAISQSNTRSVSQTLDPSVKQWISQSSNEPVKQWTIHSVCQATYQSVNKSITQSLYLPVSRPVGWSPGESLAGSPEQRGAADVDEGAVDKLAGLAGYGPALGGRGAALPQAEDTAAHGHLPPDARLRRHLGRVVRAAEGGLRVHDQHAVGRQAVNSLHSTGGVRIS